MTQPIELEYFFDPLCGWCYASAPALDALAEAYPEALAMQPSGLFAADGARPMKTMADHAWRNDTRIGELTGQVFTTAYRDRVLRNPEGLFDSIHATRAMVALGEIDAKLEPALLHALQTARYVDARDTTHAEVVADVAVRLAKEHGRDIDAEAFTERLTADQELSARTAQRIRATQERMQGLPSAGVPQLLVTVGDHSEVVQGSDLYGGAAVVFKAIDEVKARAAATR